MDQGDEAVGGFVLAIARAIFPDPDGKLARSLSNEPKAIIARTELGKVFRGAVNSMSQAKTK